MMVKFIRANGMQPKDARKVLAHKFGRMEVCMKDSGTTTKPSALVA